MTIDELFRVYYQHHVLTRTRRPDITADFYRYYFVRWCNSDIYSLTHRAIQDWVDELGINRGKAAANRAADVMSAMLNWGIRRGYIELPSNPCRGIERFDLRSRERFLQPAEFRRFKTVLDLQKPHFRDFFWLCLLTGARKQKVLSMRWDEIDMDLQTWRIPINKNGESQTIPLTPAALAIIDRRSTSANTPWVFPAHSRSGHMEDPKIAWKRILREAGISNLRIHDLRRTVGSYMAIIGINLPTIGKALGHKDLRSTQTYARLYLEPVRNALEQSQAKMLEISI